MEKRVAIITGGSRGIGKAIALALARKGIRVAIGAKTVKSSDKLPGSIHDTVTAIKQAGSEGLAVQTDVREEDQIARLVEQTVHHFGRIDIIVNNAGAIIWEPVEQLTVRRFDRMWHINTRAPFILSHYAIPYLKKSDNAHIINMSPPPMPGNLATETWKNRTGYLMSKFGMSHLTMGLAEELNEFPVSVNSLWPNSIIDTQATRYFADMFGIDESVTWYSADMVAAAADQLIQTQAPQISGQTLIVEELLTKAGISPESFAVENPLKK